MPVDPHQLSRLKIMWECPVCRPKIEAVFIHIERERVPDQQMIDIQACDDCEVLFAQLKRAM